MDRSGAPPVVPLDDVSAVPLHRLGALLEECRGGASRATVAARSERFGAADLAAVERGELPLGDEEVAELLAIYRADPGHLAAERSRLVIDVAEGTVAAGATAVEFLPGSDGPDEILARYLALVYEMRGLRAGTPIPLRTLDVTVLSSALALHSLEVAGRLEILMTPGDGRVDRWRSQLRRRVLVPAVGLVVGITSVGVLVLLPGADPGAVGAGATATDAAVAGAAGLVEGAVPDGVLGPDLTRPLIDRAPRVVPSEAAIDPPPAAAEVPQPVGDAAPAPEEGPVPAPVEAPSTAVVPPAPAPSGAAKVPAPAPAPPPVGPHDEVVLGEGLTIERDSEPSLPPAAGDDEVVLGEGLTIERSDIEP